MKTDTPEVLDKIVDVVLAYRPAGKTPKPQTEKQNRRKAPAVLKGTSGRIPVAPATSSRAFCRHTCATAAGRCSERFPRSRQSRRRHFGGSASPPPG